MRKSLNFLAVTILVISFAPAAVFADEPSAASQQAAVVNINTADAAQFALLPQIGLKSGQRIVAYRDEHGPFQKATDLMQVKGIGDKIFALISPYLVVEGNTTLVSEVRSPGRPRAKKSSNTAQ